MKIRAFLPVCALFLAFFAPIFGQTSPAARSEPAVALSQPPSAKEIQDAKKKAALEHKAALEDVIAVVQEVLKPYASPGTSDLPPLQSAEFEFQVTENMTFGGKISWWIISVGGSVQVDNLQDMTFNYSVPKGKTARDAITMESLGLKPEQTLKGNLTDALKIAALEAKNEFLWGGKKLDKKITVKVHYGVKVDFNVGANIPIYTLIVGPSADWNKNSVQTVTLTFANPASP